MSAAATAAGYLYASGRLRGKTHKDDDRSRDKGQHGHQGQPANGNAQRREVKVAVYEPQHEERPAAPRKQPKIAYRKPRWKPE